MITCISQHNKTLRILQFKLLMTGPSPKGWQSEYYIFKLLKIVIIKAELKNIYNNKSWIQFNKIIIN